MIPMPEQIAELAHDKRAMLYRACDFPAICEAVAKHLLRVGGLNILPALNGEVSRRF